MAQTTTAFNWCDIVIRLDNAVGTLTDVSGVTNKVDPEFSNEIGDFRTFASNWAGRISCGQDAAFSIDIYMSTSTSEAWAILKDWFFTQPSAKKTLQLDFPSGSSGGDRLQCECVLESMDWSGKADEPAPTMVSLSVKPDGAVALSVIP